MNNRTTKAQSCKDYYYARREKLENGEKLLEVPIIVNAETAEDNRHHYSMVRIGFRKYPCIYDWIPESYYHTHKCMLEQESKQDERANRCLIVNPKNPGERIPCPEKNRCSTCPYEKLMEYDNGRAASLDALFEDSFSEGDRTLDFPEEHSDPEELFLEKEEETEMEEKLLVLIDLLMKKKPRYADIFRELCNGEHNAAAIARRFGLNPHRTAEDVKMIKELVKDWLEELRT